MRIVLLGDLDDQAQLQAGLRSRGFEATCASAHVARATSAPPRADAIVVDWDRITADDRAWLAELDAQTRRIVLAREPAADATRSHRFTTWLLKPCSVHTLEVALRATTRRGAPRAEASAPTFGRTPAPERVLVESRNPVMNRLLNLAWRAAETDASVLLLGESGTGKTALAAAIHARSGRRHAPFVTVHCPCLHPQLLESQLFGHAQGAFTGAVSDSVGRVEAAAGGTLFLDEVGDLPLDLQPKLLRLLQDREFERVGDCETRRADIRVIAATHRNLPDEVAAGRFREDLYYRLNVVALRVVPLRRRCEDILPLARAFLAQVTRTGRPPPRDFSMAAQAMLQAHPWPGNLRELRNAVERAAILTPGEVVDRTDLWLDGDGAHVPAPRVGEMVSLSE
ncbi:MAG TPA: sigma-54 dependent transcriptional regulator, partial [Candidatus Synoicihabitans sp.]|nr:sigma-54 dependent transcriptional regulator [Candidatus Synoicihabitans sp.]